MRNDEAATTSDRLTERSIIFIDRACCYIDASRECKLSLLPVEKIATRAKSCLIDNKTSVSWNILASTISAFACSVLWQQHKIVISLNKRPTSLAYNFQKVVAPTRMDPTQVALKRVAREHFANVLTYPLLIDSIYLFLFLNSYWTKHTDFVENLIDILAS